MRRKLLIGTALSFVAVGMVTLVAVAPSRKVALVRFIEPTIIAGVAVLGPVIFEHDDEKMARGEPCTTVYYVNSETGLQGEKVVTFMCVPRERALATKFQATRSHMSPSGPERLLEYQFAGEREGHGVPISADHGHAR